MCRVMPAPSHGGYWPRVNIRTWTCDERGSLVSIYCPIRYIREVLVVDAFGFALAVAVPWHPARRFT